ncbi:MAG: hypothetical protein K9H64_11215 [Bacteroidales bacterium]|nr:hypothetical protein [Bacteroidales bacterium]MCF8456520.1 hypothetical protein [Bacteroidales bacterium]
MQRVILTIDDTKNAYSFLQFIKQFNFVPSVELEKSKSAISEEDEIFTDDWQDDFFLDDLGMTVKEFRLQTLKDENEEGMS